MKLDELRLSTAYAIKDRSGRKHRAVLLSLDPHELTFQYHTNQNEEPYILSADTGHYRGWGKVSGRGLGHDSTTRGLPVVLANGHGAGAEIPTAALLDLAALHVRNGFLGRRDMTLANGMRLTVIRPHDVVCTWAEHVESEAIARVARQAEQESLEHARADAEAARERVFALLNHLGVRTTPPLMTGYTVDSVSTFPGCSWEALEKLLAAVAREAAADVLSKAVEAGS